MKKQKKVLDNKPMPRFKHGTGVDSWKLAAALVLALALGIGGGIAMSQHKVRPVLTDHLLGIQVDPPSQNAAG